MKKNLNKNISNIIFKILVVILIGVAVVLVISWVHIRKEAKEPSSIAKELYSYFDVEDLNNCEGLFNYSTGKITYDSVDENIRLCLAYQKSDIKEVKEETYKASKGKNVCEKDNMIFKAESNECKVRKFPKKILNDTYKKIFGHNIENNTSFNYDNNNICYLKDDMYYCGLSEVSLYYLSGDSTIYRTIRTVEEKRSEIVIYDYFVKVLDEVCFDDYSSTIRNEKCTKKIKNTKKVDYNFMKKYGNEYKHVFKKDNKSYYWESSEPVK